MDKDVFAVMVKGRWLYNVIPGTFTIQDDKASFTVDWNGKERSYTVDLDVIDGYEWS
jgi:hypothetical protein